MAINTDPLIVDPALLGQAELLCKRRLGNNPEDRAALRSLAEVCRKLGKLGEAAAAYERLFRLDSQDQEAGYLRAVLVGEEGPLVPKGIRAAPFVLLKDFLPRDFHDTLLPFLVSARERFVPALVSGDGSGRYDPGYRETLDFTDRWESKKRFRDCFEAILPRLAPRLHVAPFQVASVELHVRAYQDGHFFKVHVDAVSDRPAIANRVVSFVYFFHRLPRPYEGGELLLFDSDTETGAATRARFTQVVPEDNALVVFPSNFWHCVVPVRCRSKDFADSRFVINGFVHRRVGDERAVVGSVEQTSGAV